MFRVRLLASFGSGRVAIVLHWAGGGGEQGQEGCHCKRAHIFVFRYFVIAVRVSIVMGRAPALLELVYPWDVNSAGSRKKVVVHLIVMPRLGSRVDAYLIGVVRGYSGRKWCLDLYYHEGGT